MRNTPFFDPNARNGDRSKPKKVSEASRQHRQFDDVTVRPLFAMESEACDVPEQKTAMQNKPEEIQRVIKRIMVIIDEHRDAATHLNITLGKDEMHVVLEALRNHAKTGATDLKLNEAQQADEILTYGMTRLFEELVEEPSNILFTTSTGKDTVRYEAMDTAFWIECLNQLEQQHFN